MNAERPTWFKVARGWREHDLFEGETFSRAEAWLWLIENAAWKPTRTRIKGAAVELNRGQLSFSVRFMADQWGWSKSRVDRFIAVLREEGMIETCSKIGTDGNHNAGQGQSVITICNYAKYQNGEDDRRDNSGTTRGTTAGQQRDKEEERKKERIEEGREEPRAAAFAHSLSDEVPLDHHDTLAIAQECARAGGVRFVDPGHIGDGVNLIREWQQAGADPPLMIDTIRQVVTTTKQKRIGSLKFFDGAIRKEVAKQEAQRNGHNQSEPETLASLALRLASGGDPRGQDDTIRLGFAG